MKIQGRRQFVNIFNKRGCMRYKVLLAIDNQGAENAFKSKLAQANPDYEVVACVVSEKSVMDYLEDNGVNVLVLIEGLGGSSDSFKFARDLKLKYPSLRIVFIAGQRGPGDQNLAKLVSYQIFDILAGNVVSVGNMVEKTINPSTWQDASIYLPNGGKDEIFTEEEMKDTDPDSQISTTEVNTTTTEVLSDENEHRQLAGMSLKDKFNIKKNMTKLDDDDLEADDSPRPSKPHKITITPKKESDDEDDGDEGGGGFNLLPFGKNKVDPGINEDDSDEVKKLKRQLADMERKLKNSEDAKKKEANKVKKLSDEKDRIAQELHELDKSRTGSSKQKVITFFGTVPGVGTSTLALNTATYLALKGFKTIYVEFNEILPTLSYWFDLSDIESGLEKAFFGIETRNYEDIDDCIVTKEDILALKSDMNDKHQKYPENLHYMFFSDSYIKSGEIVGTNPNTLKDLLLYLLYKSGYDYVILDVYSHSDFHILETSTIFSSWNVFVMTQDVVTIGASLKMFAALRSNGVEFEFLRDPTDKNASSVNYKNIYLVNKYNSNVKLNKSKIKSWLEADRVMTIPENSTDIVNGLFNALPAVLVSKNRELLVSIKDLTEAFKK